jgi:predicted RNase H-like HicB family nuclease
MRIKVILERGRDGYVVARCPSLKSCWSQGKTRDEALRNIREAIELYLEPAPGQIPADDKAEVVELS